MTSKYPLHVLDAHYIDLFFISRTGDLPARAASVQCLSNSYPDWASRANPRAQKLESEHRGHLSTSSTRQHARISLATSCALLAHTRCLFLIGTAVCDSISGTKAPTRTSVRNVVLGSTALGAAWLACNTEVSPDVLRVINLEAPLTLSS